jgi:hypothetical protein
MATRGDPTKLNNQFPSKNPTITWFKRKFCKWGKKRLEYEIHPFVLGSPAPLWKNPSKKFYKIFFILNLISSLLFVLFFVAVNIYNAAEKSGIMDTINTNLNLNTNSTSSVSTSTSANSTSTNPTSNSTDVNTQCLDAVSASLKPQFIIIGSAILLINAGYARFISKIDYASDEEWFRYLVMNFVCCVGLGLFNMAEYLDFSTQMSFFQETLLLKYESATNCIILFKVNLWSNFVNTVTITSVCAIQITKIFDNFNRLFIQEAEPARTDDKDIVVYTS